MDRFIQPQIHIEVWKWNDLFFAWRLTGGRGTSRVQNSWPLLFEEDGNLLLLFTCGADVHGVVFRRNNQKHADLIIIIWVYWTNHRLNASPSAGLFFFANQFPRRQPGITSAARRTFSSRSTSPSYFVFLLRFHVCLLTWLMAPVRVQPGFVWTPAGLGTTLRPRTHKHDRWWGW